MLLCGSRWHCVAMKRTRILALITLSGIGVHEPVAHALFARHKIDTLNSWQFLTRFCFEPKAEAINPDKMVYPNEMSSEELNRHGARAMLTPNHPPPARLLHPPSARGVCAEKHFLSNSTRARPCSVVDE